MHIGFRGEVLDEPGIRAGVVGCGSHAWRNIFPVFRFTPVDLVAVCDLKRASAEACARKLGVGGAYTDYLEMIEKEGLEAVFVCTGTTSAADPSSPGSPASAWRRVSTCGPKNHPQPLAPRSKR